MINQRKSGYETDDELFAQLDFLRYDYDKAIETNEQQKQDIQKLLALLVERNIPIPDDISSRYIRHVETDSDEAELPFD